MAIETIAQIKTYFETGDRPTEAQFVNLIDTLANGGAKVYKALLTQSGTNAPVATISVNQMVDSPVISRDSLGYYLIESDDFIKGKTYVTIGSASATGVEIYSAIVTSGTVEVVTYIYNIPAGGITNVEGLGYLDDTPITIEVYP